MTSPKIPVKMMNPFKVSTSSSKRGSTKVMKNVIPESVISSSITTFSPASTNPDICMLLNWHMASFLFSFKFCSPIVSFCLPFLAWIKYLIYICSMTTVYYKSGRWTRKLWTLSRTFQTCSSDKSPCPVLYWNWKNISQLTGYGRTTFTCRHWTRT